MTTTDRLRQAAQTIRDTAEAVAEVHPGAWTYEPNGNGQNVMLRSPERPGASRVATANWTVDAAHIALWSPPVALALADWLDDIAADKDSGLGSIHPRALDVTNLILGDDQ